MDDHPIQESSQPGRLRFGEIAIGLGLLNADQLAEALRRQEELAAAGRPRLIGELLAECHALELRGVQKVLLEQQRRRAREGDEPGHTPDAPANFGQYKVLEVIGAGGMGTVYKVEDTRTGAVAALKALVPRLVPDAEFAARFEREVRAAEALSHPNIVKCLGSGREGGQPYMVMEYVLGQNLGRLMGAELRLPERRALEIARDVAQALDHAHGQGVVHRDVKPDNVLLSPAGPAKLADFGLAKLLREDQRLTQSGMALGTPHYISPEQVAASRHIDHRADQYSLGAMLYFMLTGREPFDGPSNNDIMLRHLEDEPTDPRQFAPDLSLGTVQIVYKLLAKKAADRYDATGHAVEDLQCAMKALPPRYAKALTTRPSSAENASQERGCAAVLLLAFLSCLIHKMM